MNVNKYIEAPQPDPNSKQYKEENTTVINDSYNQTLTKKTQAVMESIQSGRQLTVTHSLNIGVKEGLNSPLEVTIPFIGQLTGAVVTAKLSTPVYKTRLLGASSLKGYYTHRVNNDPTWVQLDIYNKLKVISQHNPTIWSKLKELGFDLNNQTKGGIFNGVIDLTDHHASGSLFESHTQIYELDTNGNINYSKSVGGPIIKTGQLPL